MRGYPNRRRRSTGALIQRLHERQRKTDIGRVGSTSGGGGSAAKVACRSAVTTHNSEAVVPFDEVIYDPAGLFSAGAFVAPADGIYSAKFGPVSFTPFGSQGWPNTSGRMAAYIVLNGSDYVGEDSYQVGSTDFTNAGYVGRPLRLNAPADVFMTAGETLDARIFTHFDVDVVSGGGSSGSSQDDGSGMFFSIAKVG